VSDTLKHRLRQARPFESEAQQALLNLFVASAEMRGRIEAICQQHGLTFSQYNILRILRGAPPEGHPRSEIIDRMIDRSPDVTRLIDRLERMGLVQRKRSEKDRRVMLHSITISGKELLRLAHPAFVSVQDFLLERVSPRDLTHLNRILEGIYADYEEE
jgi:DNA-binding MarR family transcriptional regulator